jgi:hypothetical protein
MTSPPSITPRFSRKSLRLEEKWWGNGKRGKQEWKQLYLPFGVDTAGVYIWCI